MGRPGALDKNPRNLVKFITLISVDSH